MPTIVNLGFTCLNFAALPKDVNYASFAWDVIEEGVCHFLWITYCYMIKRRGRDGQILIIDKLAPDIATYHDVSTHLTGKSDKSKATAPLGSTIHHDNGINDFAKLLKEAEELIISDCITVHMLVT